MERDVKAVQIHYDKDAKFFPELVGETLRITLSTGRMISIELFEREEGYLYIRADNRRMNVQPEASNAVRIGVE